MPRRSAPLRHDQPRSRRLGSRSTQQSTNRGESGAPAGSCAPYELTKPGRAAVRRVGLDAVGWEIHELLPVTGTEGCPGASPTVWRDALIDGFRGRNDQHQATIARLHAQVAERDRTIAWLHQEVGSRDTTVASLHAEVALRDRLVEELRQRLAPTGP